MKQSFAVFWFVLVLTVSRNGAAADEGRGATPADRIKIAQDFKVELLYSPPKSQGSWVSMCADAKGRLIVCDQYDGGLYRVTPPPVGAAGAAAKVERINAELSGAQGLVWAFDSLYAMVSKNGKHDSGLYRVRSAKGDDQLDQVELLRPLEGGGDHGWHGLVAGLDGKSIYVVAGDATRLRNPERSRVPMIWGEDHLLPRIPDARGFMTDVLAPGGCFYRVDPTGKEWELLSTGFRNPYGAAFNRYGDLLTFDADMEWDMNTPWYRPTRVCLVASGSEFGWRNGSGKWPAYYPDSLPAVLDVGPGSPVGMTFGYGAKFPASYQEALFLPDWSYGRMLVARLKPDGAAYKGETELFLAGAPLPTTAILVNPRDGAMYFVTGGWRIQTGLYRVTYTGKESTSPAPPADDGAALRKLRRRLEALHGRQDPQAVETVWPYLGHGDRYIRFAARVALEWQDPSQWRERALRETSAPTALTALLALARASARDEFHRQPADPAPDPALQGRMLAALDRLEWQKLTPAQRVDLLRVYAVTFTRLGPPDEPSRARLAAKLDSLFPAATRELNAELCELLAYLQSPSLAGKALGMVEQAPTQEEQIEYIKSLRVLRAGWTPELRVSYFKWFAKAGGYRGGASFAGFMKLIKNDAIATLTEAEKTRLRPVLDAPPTARTPLQAMQEGLPGHSFVKEWTVNELAPLAERGLRNRGFDRGRKFFGALGCFACHRFANEGGAAGPDLTGAGGRFSPRDLLESIIEPSKTISDLYASIVITLNDGDTLTGRIVYLGTDTAQVNTDMFNPGETTTVSRKDIKSIETSKVSPMPTGLLNMLSQDEVMDLLAYVLSGGDSSNAMFGPAASGEPPENARTKAAR
jgi:putative heme-binding domain-containing protein